MKKKILSLVLALLMAGSSASMIAADEAAEIAATEEAAAATVEAEAEDESTYADAIAFLYEYGIYKGTSATELAADEDIERYQMALFVARISTGWTDDEEWEDGPKDTSGFTDINDGETASNYLGAISYASQKGIIEGYGNGEFGPYDGITYQDALTMAVRTLGYTGLDWPWGNIEKAVELGLTNGIEGVAYTDILTRGEVARVVYNTLFADKNGGSTLAADNFNMSEWQSIVITASELDFYGDKDVTLDKHFLPYNTYAEAVKGNTFIGFKFFDAETGVEDDTTYYMTAAALGLDVDKHEDDMAVGKTYWVIFEEDKDGNYVDVLNYESTELETLWNMGRTDDEGNEVAYAISDFFSKVTVVSKYSSSSFVNSTKFTKPEIMLYDAIAQYQKMVPAYNDNNKSQLAVDMDKGHILVRIDDQTKVDYDYLVDGVKYDVLWYWSPINHKYYQITVDTTTGTVGYKWMKEGDLNVNNYPNWKIDPDTKKIVYVADGTVRGLNKLSAAPGASAYASLYLEDVDGDGVAERGIYEKYKLGKVYEDSRYCSKCDATVDSYVLGETFRDFYSMTGNVGTPYHETALCKKHVNPWFTEEYELSADKFVLYSYDGDYTQYGSSNRNEADAANLGKTGEIKIVKEILNKDDEARTDADSYIDYGVLRAYSISKGNVIIGDETYSFNGYNELEGNGLSGSASLADGLVQMLNQYVEFVVVDGKVAAMEPANDLADSAYLVVKNYAGLTNDGYIAVEAYDMTTGKLGIYCIASYNGWRMGDYYYYNDNFDYEDAFAAGTMYYVKSYEPDFDAYNVEVVGSYNGSSTYTLVSDLVSVDNATTNIKILAEHYKNVGGEITPARADDTYILLLQSNTNTYVGSEVLVYQGRGANGWEVEGRRVRIGETNVYVLVDAVITAGFTDNYSAYGFYLYQGSKIKEAAYGSYYDSIFDTQFNVDGRYLLGATTYKVEMFNVLTATVEDVVIDRNLYENDNTYMPLVANQIYITKNGKIFQRTGVNLVNAINSLVANYYGSYYEVSDGSVQDATGNVINGSFAIVDGAANTNKVTTTGEQIKDQVIYTPFTREAGTTNKLTAAMMDRMLWEAGEVAVDAGGNRVKNVVFVRFNNVPEYDNEGNIKHQGGSVSYLNGYDAIIKNNKTLYKMECEYIYCPSTGTIVVYATELSFKQDNVATYNNVHQTGVIAANVNGTEADLIVDVAVDYSVNVKANADGEPVKELDELNGNNVYNKVTFSFEGADDMGHDEIADAGICFGHLSDHVGGALLGTDSALYVNGEEVVDIFTKSNHKAITYETYACGEDCDLIKSITIDLEALGVNAKFHDDSTVRLQLTVNGKKWSLCAGVHWGASNKADFNLQLNEFEAPLEFPEGNGIFTVEAE